jgi:hypothetical protein
VLQPDLFIDGMVHANDPYTSVEAAVAVTRRLTELHAQVLAAFKANGAMTDEDLEQLPQFRTYGPSTIRKRRSELWQQSLLGAVGERINSRGRRMLLWALKEAA